MQKHPRQMRLRQFAPPLLVVGLVMGAFVAPWSWLLLAMAGGPYLLAVIAASLWTSRSTPPRSWPLLPAIFAALHLGYGSGFLWGLLRFAGRWGGG